MAEAVPSYVLRTPITISTQFLYFSPTPIKRTLTQWFVRVIELTEYWVLQIPLGILGNFERIGLS